MNNAIRWFALTCCLLHLTAEAAKSAEGTPLAKRPFPGRIAYSCDGNHNDPDDWIASPVALAIFAEAGLKDRVVHVDYNCILPLTDPAWEQTHADSVLGAAERYGYNRAHFFDCRRELDRAVADIAQAVDESSADDPLWFILAGPMEVPYLGIQKSDPAKRQFVYCISHSSWNDGFSNKYQYTHTKRSVIEQDVHWVQLPHQGRLSTSPYGREPRPDEWRPFHWMRDSQDERVRWLWERMLVSTRPDCSDAGMAWFLATGDEQCDPAKLKQLLDEHHVPTTTRRSHVRIEAENFRGLDGFAVEYLNDKKASQAVQVAATASTGSIRTRLDEPFAPDSDRVDVEVRYFDAAGDRSRLGLFVNGATQDEAWQTLGEGRGWMSRTIRNVALRRGDEIMVEVQSEGEPHVKLDYVQLSMLGGASDSAAAVRPRPGPIAALDDPAALPGQLIVAGERPGYLKYNGGGPAYLCGPDNPEEFFFLGTLNDDGTRSGGGQEQLIATMAQAGVSVFHCQVFRMRRCNIKDEGDDRHCPFVGFDPARPLNDNVLAQWEGWLKQMEQAGINVHLEFYNDATDVERMGWKLDARGALHPDEERFFTGVVNRFQHLKNVIWGIEESVNKLPRDRTPHFIKLSALIARLDQHHHPIVHSFVTPDTSEHDFGPDSIMSDEYAGDPNIHVTTWLHVLPHGTDYEAQHREYLKYARLNSDRFILMKNETERFPRTREDSRRYMWACAMTGMHAPEAGHDAVKRAALLADDGRIRKFMERTDFYAMRSRDELAAGATKWVLANPGRSYIAYTYDCSGPMGVRDMAAGVYDLTWFDTVNGRTVTQTEVPIPAGDVVLNKPESFGNEIALYIRRSAQANKVASAVPKVLRVAVVQSAVRATLAENRDRIIAGIAQAAERQARVAVFCERALSGAGEERSDLVDEAVEAIRRAAHKRQINVVFGAHTWRPSVRKSINWMLAIGPDGRDVASYEKLYDNHRAVMPGVFLIDGVPCGTMICADRWLRGVVELPIQQGAQINFELSNNYACEWVAPYEWYWSVPLARRNTVWSVLANSANEDATAASSLPSTDQRHGHSAIIAPDGRLVAVSHGDVEDLLVADIEIADATRAEALARAAHPVLRPFWEAGLKLQRGETIESAPLKPFRSPETDVSLAVAPVAGDVAKIVSFIREASSRQADLVAFPAQAVAEESLERVRAAAKEHSITVVIGARHRASGGTWNSAFVIGPDGALLTRYDQLSARDSLRAGTDVGAMWFRVKGVPAVVTLGRDVLWTELSELAAVAGARIHVHFDHVPNDTPDTRQRRLQAYANCASFLTFTATVNVGEAMIWDDLQGREESRAVVKGTPQPDPGKVEVFSPFSANLVARAPSGEIVVATRRVTASNPHHPGRTSQMNPQLKAWYELGAQLISR